MTSRNGLILLRSFDFKFTCDAIRAYREALGFPEGEEVPTTFAARFLTEPAVLAELHSIFGDEVLVHIAQSFDVSGTLNPGLNYKVSLKLEVLHSRMHLTGTFLDPSEAVCVVMRSEFLSVQPEALK